jgi:hypothetical protein
MEEPMRRPLPGGPRNGVERRVESEALEREWLTRFFSSLGQKRPGSDTLLARMRERRIVLLRKAMRRAVPGREAAGHEKGGAAEGGRRRSRRLPGTGIDLTRRT